MELGRFNAFPVNSPLKIPVKGNPEKSKDLGGGILAGVDDSGSHLPEVTAAHFQLPGNDTQLEIGCVHGNKQPECDLPCRLVASVKLKNLHFSQREHRMGVDRTPGNPLPHWKGITKLAPLFQETVFQECSD